MPMRDDERAGTMASGASLPLNSSTSFSPKTTPRFGCWCFRADRSVATACGLHRQVETWEMKRRARTCRVVVLVPSVLITSIPTPRPPRIVVVVLFRSRIYPPTS